MENEDFFCVDREKTNVNNRDDKSTRLVFIYFLAFSMPLIEANNTALEKKQASPLAAIHVKKLRLLHREALRGEKNV